MESGILKPPVAGAKVTRVTAEYYYRMQERVVYRRYSIYGSKSEPPGYLAKLAVADPKSYSIRCGLRLSRIGFAQGGMYFDLRLRFSQ